VPEVVSRVHLEAPREPEPPVPPPLVARRRRGARGRRHRPARPRPGVGLSKDGLVEAAANPPSQPDTNPYDDIRRFDTDPFQPGIQLADPIHAELPLDVTHLTGSGDALPDALPDAFPDAGFGDVLP